MADTLSMRHVEQSEQVQAYSDSFTHYFDYLSKQTLMHNLFVAHHQIEVHENAEMLIIMLT